MRNARSCSSPMGEIGFEREVLTQIQGARLPKRSCLHTVGVGSAVNRSLTSPAARAGGGIEVVIGIDEDAERAAARVLRRTRQPLVTELSFSGSAIVQAAIVHTRADLFAGAPATLAVMLRAEGGELVVRGRTATGVYEERRTIAATNAGAGDVSPCRAVGARARRRSRARCGDARIARPDRSRDRVARRRAPDRDAPGTSFVAVSDAVDCRSGGTDPRGDLAAPTPAT